MKTRTEFENGDFYFKYHKNRPKTKKGEKSRPGKFHTVLVMRSNKERMEGALFWDTALQESKNF